MPELFAALTDLFAPDADAVADASVHLPRLPTLERLLSRAERHPAPADWRRWALAVAGLTPPPGDLPVGRTLAARHGAVPDADSTWFVATPVHCVAGLTRVRFDSHGALSLDEREAGALVQRFAVEWGDPALALVAAGESLLLRAAGRYDVATVDPAACAGRELEAALPTGSDAGRLERLTTELQMWLHRAPPTSREGPPVNGLWLWGSGSTPLTGAARWPALASHDPFLAAAAAGAAGSAADARLETWQLAELVRAGRGFEAADGLWFEPLARALRGGELDSARLYVAGHEFVLRPRQRWRRWIRARPWWQLLA